MKIPFSKRREIFWKYANFTMVNNIFPVKKFNLKKTLILEFYECTVGSA